MSGQTSQQHLHWKNNGTQLKSLNVAALAQMEILCHLNRELERQSSVPASLVCSLQFTSWRNDNKLSSDCYMHVPTLLGNRTALPLHWRARQKSRPATRHLRWASCSLLYLPLTAASLSPELPLCFHFPSCAVTPRPPWLLMDDVLLIFQICERLKT